MSGESTWELFQSGQEPSDVRQEVLTSWRRSQMSGVDPEHVDVPYLETNLDSQFSRVAIPIMTGMAELLVGDSSCLALSDATGSVIWRWVSEPMLRNTLDDLLVVEGFNFGEELVGTNGLGTALEVGALVSVSGSEHYVHRFHHVTCVAAPVRHPITRRTVGAVNVTCRASESNFLLRTVVRKLVDELQTALYDRATSRERQLLSAFLDEQRRAAGPLAVIGDGLIITNPQAADLGLGRLDLWDDLRARRSVDGKTPLSLPDELVADVSLVGDSSSPVGAVVRVTGPTGTRPSVAPRRRRSPPSADDLDVTPESSLNVRARALTTDGPLAMLGEAGTGKATVLQHAFGGVAVLLDAATFALDPASWLLRLAQLAQRGPAVVRHVELLDDAAVRSVVAALGAPLRPPHLGLTITVAGGGRPRPSTNLLLNTLRASTLWLPPLRRDPDAIIALAQAELQLHRPGAGFAADAVPALRRHLWPGNRSELARVVRDAAREADSDVVGVAHLADEIRQAGRRRALTPLEHAEASTIALILREHHGNKSTAARELGISRTAMYTKIRTYRL